MPGPGRRAGPTLARVAAALAMGALVLALGRPAFAASPEDVAAAVGDQGFYVESGATADASRLGSLVSNVASRGYRVYLIVLASDPPGGSTTFADAILDRTGAGTAVVLSPGELGYSSTDFDAETLNTAADASLAAFDRDPVDGFTTFADQLTVPSERPGDSGGGSPVGGVSTGLIVVVAVVVALVAVVAFVSWRSRRSERARAEGDVDEARREIQGQIAALANGILELSDRVGTSTDQRAKGYFQEANATYAAATDEVGAAKGLGELERLADRLDDARWKIEATRAILDGTPVPPQPADRPACFFDPSHGAGVIQAGIRTPAGTKSVGVCRTCAEKLQRGEQPDARQIQVGGRAVPAPYAPRSYGGGGNQWLGPLSILLGSAARPVVWGPSPVRFPGWGGASGAGGGIGGSRGRGGRMRVPRGFGGRSRGGRRR
jgi:hypothetical protein